MDLLHGEPCVAKHTNLVSHVVPGHGAIAGAGAGFQLLAEQHAHGLDAVSHALALAVPLRLELGVRQHLGYDPGAVDGRAGIHGAHNELDLAGDALRLLLVFAHHREVAHALSIQTKVLGKGLSEHHQVTVGHKLAQCVRIRFGIAAGKSLICTVEKDHVLLLLHHHRQLIPLFPAGVAARGVVGASMEHEQRSIIGGAHVLQQTRKVQRASGVVVVGVKCGLQTGVAEHSKMISPRRLRNVHLDWAKELLH
mmetsp:Transcript_23085/g.46746  ORF Transcript_23085/g.46746 Transcript_23085/m.46746 type:complete len:252 (+) Transcript_23085:283-1038(+)